MFNDLNKYKKCVNLNTLEFDDFTYEQTKYLMSIIKEKKFISQRDLKKSYMILDKYQSKTFKNKVREFTNNPKIIDNIEKIVLLRLQKHSHQQIANVVPISKATIQKYLKLLGVD